MTVSQCVGLGDDYHDISVFVLRSDEVELQEVKTVKYSPRYDQESSSFKSGIQDYLYLLPGSNFTYRICMASTTSKEQRATYLLFDNIEDYFGYTEDVENGESYALYSKAVDAGKDNQTTCTEIVHNVTDPAYFFMVVRSPGNIYYYYNFSVNAVMYNTTNITQYCKLTDFGDCSISLESKEFEHIHHDVITYVQPDFSEQSIITHLCLTTLPGSTTLQKITYVSWSLLGVGALLLVAVAVVSLFVIVVHVHKKNTMMNEERQKLLHNY